jgi:uncharacterized protein (TIGR00255 family)
MLYSMTGYGKATGKVGSRSATIEIKAVNSRHLDLNLRTCSAFKAKEIEIRRLLGDALIRGRIDVIISEDKWADEVSDSLINRDSFKRYYYDLKNICQELRLDDSRLLETIMRIPDVLVLETTDLSEEEWEALQNIAQDALNQFLLFRQQEGEGLANDLLNRLQLIEQYAQQVEQIAPIRVQTIKQRLQDDLQQWINPEIIDRNRFEQELLYYLERLDITEELVRLHSHCRYFSSEIKTKNSDKGKKLNFITQEIGREINTIGSKANHADMQMLVVQMKDELEKIKEQLMNII